MIIIRKYIIYALLIIGIAVAFTYLSVPIYKNIVFVKNDIWSSVPSLGDPKRSIYTRAYVAT